MRELQALYREAIRRHAAQPVGLRKPIEATHAHECSNPLCGDRVEIRMKLVSGMIEDIAFDGEACTICMASASMLCEQAVGQPADRLVEFHEPTAAEAACETFTRQAEAVAHGLYAHAAKCGSGCLRPVDTAEWQSPQRGQQVGGLADAGTPAMTREPGCAQRCRRDRESRRESLGLESRGNLPAQRAQTTEQAQAAGDLEHEDIRTGHRHAGRELFQPAGHGFECLLFGEPALLHEFDVGLQRQGRIGRLAGYDACLERRVIGQQHATHALLLGQGQPHLRDVLPSAHLGGQPPADGETMTLREYDALIGAIPVEDPDRKDKIGAFKQLRFASDWFDSDLRRDVISPIKNLRSWAFVLCFLCIGLSTRFADLMTFGLKPFWAFTIGVLVNVPLGFFLSTVVFSRFWSNISALM